MAVIPIQPGIVGSAPASTNSLAISHEHEPAVDCCENFSEFQHLVDKRIWPLALISEKSGCNLSLEVIERLRPQIETERTQVVILSETPSAADAMLCYELGATDYRAWPQSPQHGLPHGECDFEKRKIVAAGSGR